MCSKTITVMIASRAEIVKHAQPKTTTKKFAPCSMNMSPDAAIAKITPSMKRLANVSRIHSSNCLIF